MSKEITLSLSGQKRRSSVYFKLTKPKVVALMLITAVVGMSLAPVADFPWVQASIGLMGIGLMAGSAAAFNHLIDRRIDARMVRTHKRPLPSGDTNPLSVTVFASILGAFGFVLLYLWVNPLTAWLTLMSLLGYAMVYTMYLKRATPQNIVIAGIAGAMPPLLGWTAVTGDLHANAWLLVMIIFIWTPPHFWALAIHRVEDYRKVDIPMLPVTHGVEYTKTSILLYTILLTLVCVMPVLVGMVGWVYLAISLLLNGGFIYHAWKLKYAPQVSSAMQTFKFSIYHLFVLFIALLVDHHVIFIP